ncbi:50S ribosomal protein L25 [candidate division WWE3 bacterium CG10_big_fil_rev_8_21_14_0_10_32_10]|uniref:Large ribosomal subunit protein bL25 n=1 Tax=candidate division WWE3 bacterium CG10_big_fil_rev_8_21_14_0_10_32_10 TaxID=1975090 RepID=A0A2H0RAD4_UNCKA|nr:MAG: 50S ribosomal protein L25 [candidate division WWE3 bacterium CG10_big_fil_rev_8_21_14_0_10_32_10]
MKVKAKLRNIKGSGVKKLRRKGILPAVVFSKGKDSKEIQINYIEFVKAYEEAGETEIIDIQIEDENKEVAALISEIQLHPLTNVILHANFHEVDLNKKVRVNIPIEYIGIETHPLIKNQSALFLPTYDEIEVQALPRELPQHFELRIESLKEIGDFLTVKDLKKTIDISKIEIMVEDEETVIAKLDYAEMQEEPEEEERSVEDIEVTSEKEETEEEKAEGKEKPEKKEDKE